MSNHRPILIIDGSPVWALSTTLLLSQLGYRSTSATTGNAAISLFQVDYYTAVLLDNRLTDMSWIDCVNGLMAVGRKSDIKTPIIGYATAWEQFETDTWQTLGLKFLLSKECSAEELREAISSF